MLSHRDEFLSVITPFLEMQRGMATPRGATPRVTAPEAASDAATSGAATPGAPP